MARHGKKFQSRVPKREEFIDCLLCIRFFIVFDRGYFLFSLNFNAGVLSCLKSKQVRPGYERFFGRNSFCRALLSVQA
jgi:hypothetical protein